MKRKVVGILVTGMIIASLTGCGTKTEVEATSQAVESSDTGTQPSEEENAQEEVIVQDTEADNSVEVEETENNTSTDDAVYEEHEFFYVYADNQLDITDATPMDMNDLHSEDKTYTLQDSVNIYALFRGARKGYTKPNIEVYVVSCNEDWYCLYFENEATPNDCVLVKAEDFIASAGIEVDNTSNEMEEQVLITLDEIKECFAEEIKSKHDYDFSKFEMLDSSSSDMEFVEFRVPKYHSDDESLQLELWMTFPFMDYDLENYHKFYIEQFDEELGKFLWLRVYYKN